MCEVLTFVMVGRTVTFVLSRKPGRVQPSSLTSWRLAVVRAFQVPSDSIFVSGLDGTPMAPDDVPFQANTSTLTLCHILGARFIRVGLADTKEPLSNDAEESLLHIR